MVSAQMNIQINLSHGELDNWTPEAEQLQRWCIEALTAADSEPGEFEVSVRIVDEAEGRQLNASYRDKDYATNVLSFPTEIPAGFTQLPLQPLGDIALCAAVVEREAREQGKVLENHWAHLVIHGILHLLGYDHETDEAASGMETIEIAALQKLGIANPYLVG